MSSKHSMDATEYALAKYRRFHTIVIAICVVGFVLLCVFGGR